MTYETVAAFAQTYGLVFLVVMFLAVLAYALWPGNKRKFHDAAHRLLDED